MRKFHFEFLAGSFDGVLSLTTTTLKQTYNGSSCIALWDPIDLHCAITSSETASHIQTFLATSKLYHPPPSSRFHLKEDGKHFLCISHFARSQKNMWRYKLRRRDRQLTGQSCWGGCKAVGHGNASAVNQNIQVITSLHYSCSIWARLV